VEVDAGGGIRVSFRFGSERLQVNTKIPNVDFANGQPHVIYFNRFNGGKEMTLRVSCTN